MTYDVIRHTPNGRMLASSHRTREAAEYAIRLSEECYRQRGRQCCPSTIEVCTIEPERVPLYATA